VWAFGCCLYEALTGKRPFKGATTSDLLAEILKSDPDYAVIPPETPSEVLTLLRRCLEKEPRRRLRDLGDIAITLEETSSPSRTGVYSAPSTTGISTANPSGTPQPNWAWPVVATLSAALVVTGFLLLRGGKTPATTSNIRSLAVLPFAFETQDPKLSGLGKWIPAEIRSKLGPLQNLQVVNSPARIEQLVQQKKSEMEIARELGVDGLVMGELHGQGETMSAYVWVVDGATGRALGRQREIASSAAKVSELPNQVALAIVDELKLQVSTSQRTEIQDVETQNAEAFLAYQKGRDLLNRSLFEQAAVELRRAFQLDTNYTRAWVALTETEWIPLIYGGTTNEMAATFKRLSGEAERFGARRPEDQAVAALRMWMALVYERDWNKVSATFWDIQRKPKPDPWVMNAMSLYYTYIEGHPELALNAIEQAIALAPEDLRLPINRAYRLGSFGRYDDAVRAFRSLPPEKIQLEDYSGVLLVAGDVAGAKQVATRVLAGRPNAWTQCYLAAIHAKSGAPDEARKILRELEAQAEKGMHIPYAQIAWSYGMLGDFESARRWLRQALLEGHGDFSMLFLRAAEKLEMFGKLAWYWEIVDAMKFPPLQMDNPYFALEQAMRYGRGTVGPATTTTSTNEPPKTLAVLPFVNLSADKADEYLSDGMTEELLYVLAQVPGLRVPGRSSSFAFKGKNEDNIFRKVGEQLHVATVLEGSVRKAGDKLRITAQLINVADGFHLWSQTYDREMKDILAVQTEVAQQVAQALQVKLGVEATRALAKTDNPEAHRLYLLGRYHFGKATQAGWSDAIQAFNQAIQLDPNYALAYCGLADNYGFLGGSFMPGNEAWSKEKDAAQKAVALDPNLADAHLSLALALATDYDWPGVEREMRRALELNPNLALAHDQYAWVLTLHGRFDEAAAQSKTAVELDPLSPLMHVNRAYWSYLARRFDEAVVHLRKALELDPNSPWALRSLGWSLIWKGDKAGALASMEKAQSLDADPFSIGSFGYALAVSGDRVKAGQILRDLENLAKQRYVSPAASMVVYLGLGENEKALEWLEKSYADRDPTCWPLKVEPFYDSLRTEPRFQALLKKVGLDP